jgi:hypothetical protein
MLSLGVVLVSAALASCGGGSSDGTINGPGGGGAAEVGSVTVLAASPQLQSGQGNTVTITAQVKDDSNAVLEGVTVQFSASSGALVVTQPETDSLGIAVAQLSNGTNFANRAITVTVQAGDTAGSVVVNVVGTTLTITGPDALAQGDVGDYVAAAKDSKGSGVGNANLTLTSADGNTIAASTMTTDASGNVSFSVAASVAGTDTLTASGLGLTATKEVEVSGDAFAFTAPVSSDPDIDTPYLNINTPYTVTVHRSTNGAAPSPSERINFSSTRGTLGSCDATPPGDCWTDGTGDASVTISAANAGPAVLTAAVVGTGLTTTLAVEFIATTAATVELQASPLTVGVGEQSELTALVRDSIGNLVKNKTVEFLITEGTGSVSPGTDVTDSQGIAKSVYTAGGTSAANGIVIQATVQGSAPLVTDTVELTVARQALFIRLGTGNTLFEIGTATYAKEWVILVTDVDGNAIANKVVQASVRSRRYAEGALGWADPPGVWSYAAGSPAWCPDEDANKNGVLDLVNGVIGTGEDTNISGKLEAGNVALVAGVPENASLTAPCATAGAQGTAANVTTNSQGRARICVFYPQNYAEWVEATLTAKASVTGGTEFAESSVFTLQVLASDVDSETESPPNQISPFGTDLACGTGPPTP